MTALRPGMNRTDTPSYDAASPPFKNCFRAGSRFRAHPEQETISAVRKESTHDFAEQLSSNSSSKYPTCDAKGTRVRIVFMFAGYACSLTVNTFFLASQIFNCILKY